MHVSSAKSNRNRKLQILDKLDALDHSAFHEGVFGFYGYAVSSTFWLGFSVLVVKVHGFSVLNIVSVNGLLALFESVFRFLS